MKSVQPLEIRVQILAETTLKLFFPICLSLGGQSYLVSKPVGDSRYPVELLKCALACLDTVVVKK